MTGLRFRNVDASPEDPVESWPFEGILAALERGSLPDWQRLTAVIDADPWGNLARQVEEALEVSRPYGVAELFETIIATARERAAASERRQVADEIQRLVERSGLSRRAFAVAIGTSASRLSTYLSGSVVPSAALLVRMRGASERSAAARVGGQGD
ncbi:MAG: helix-turn-helix domain-containing protein [Candidatus Dormibacteraceae bacterium]